MKHDLSFIGCPDVNCSVFYLYRASSVGFTSTPCQAHAWLLKGCDFTTQGTMNMDRNPHWFVDLPLQWNLLTGQGYKDISASTTLDKLKFLHSNWIYTICSYLCKGSFTRTVNAIGSSTIFLTLHVNSTMGLHWTHFQMIRKMMTLVPVNKS